MLKNSKRNQEIVELRKDMSLKQMAQRFHICTSRVSFILRKDKDDKERATASAKLLNKIISCKNVNRKWDVVGFLDCLDLSERTRRRLKYYYQNKNIPKISLKEFMDFIITENPDPERIYRRNPVPGIYGIGKYGLRDIFKAMSSTDFGEVGNQEWKKRVASYVPYDF